MTPTTIELGLMTDREQCIALEQRIRDQELWSKEHDGRINAKWDQQDRHNARCDSEMKNMRVHIDTQFAAVFKKLGALEIKVATFAALGTVVATVAVKVLFP